jgi:hypothetical protein
MENDLFGCDTILRFSQRREEAPFCARCPAEA